MDIPATPALTAGLPPAAGPAAPDTVPGPDGRRAERPLLCDTYEGGRSVPPPHRPVSSCPAPWHPTNTSSCACAWSGTRAPRSGVQGVVIRVPGHNFGGWASSGGIPGSAQRGTSEYHPAGCSGAHPTLLAGICRLLPQNLVLPSRKEGKTALSGEELLPSHGNSGNCKCGNALSPSTDSGKGLRGLVKRPAKFCLGLLGHLSRLFAFGAALFARKGQLCPTRSPGFVVSVPLF